MEWHDDPEVQTFVMLSVVFAVFRLKFDLRMSINTQYPTWQCKRYLFDGKECTASVVFVSQNKDPNEILYPLNGLDCVVKDRFAYVHRGAGMEAADTSNSRTDMNITNAKVVRSNIDDGNLFAFALGIYFRYKYAIIIDVDRGRIPTAATLNACLEKIQSSDINAVFDTDDPAFVVATHISIRHFILYTDIKYSSTNSLKVYHDMCDVSEMCKYERLQMNRVSAPISYNDLPNNVKCEQVFSFKTENSSYAVLLPTYKRNNLKEAVEATMTQIEKPKRIVVFQNTMLTAFDFNTITQISSVPVNHFWCTNWNSYFFMTYMSVMFLHERYFIKMDDDHIPTSPRSMTDWLQYMKENPNQMIGCGGGTLKQSTCDCKVAKRPTNAVDHVAYVTMMYSWMGKLLHRYDAYTYMHGEDVAISLIGAMECNIESVVRPFPVKDSHNDDAMSHNEDRIFAEFHRQNPNIYIDIYCMYIKTGYVPKNWKKFRCRGRQVWESIRLPW